MTILLRLLPQNSRHFTGVAAAFLSSCAFAFLEVSRTMIVTVHFLTWKVRRIRITSLRRDGANRLRVCMFSLHRPLSGIFMGQSLFLWDAGKGIEQMN
jgi:hypothetical protein